MEDRGQFKIIKASLVKVAFGQFPERSQSGNILNDIAALPISQGNRLDNPVLECQ